MAETVTEELIDEYDVGNEDKEALGFIAWLRRAMSALPQEFRASVKIGFYSDWEGYSVRMKMWYERLKTRQEVENRLAQEKMRSDATAQETQRRELEIYNRLKAKYGNQ